MQQMLLRTCFSALALVLVAVLTVLPAAAQDFDEVGGPYELDEHTVVLLHFDGDLTNVSDSTEDPIPHGSTRFVPSTQFFGEGMGQAIYLDNDAVTDSSYLHIPDTTGLDLTGNWTMEAWVYLLSYGDNSSDWRWRPKLLVKPGDNSSSQSNYYNVMRGDLEAFNTGFWSPSGGGWHDIRSPNGSIRAQTAYHVTFIRDTTRHAIVQMVHNKDRELLHFEVSSYNPITEHPPGTSDRPAYIGINLGQGGGWLDGMIDEMRISNVVRNFEAPPLLTDVTTLGNQFSTDDYEVTANITTLSGGAVESAELHYDVGDGFTAVDMTATGEGDTYSASIPGQPFGSVVRYYVAAQINADLRSTVPQQAEPVDPDTEPIYNSFAVVDSTSKVLHLTFEEGSGTPVSQGDIESLQIETFGSAGHVEGGAPEGDFAYMLDGEASYLEIAGPDAAFLNSEEFVIDFWFNAVDSLPAGGTELLIKEGGSAWNAFNYRVWTPGGGRVVPAAYVPGNDGPDRIGPLVGLDTSIVADEWYRVVYLLKADTAFSQLYNADGELVDEQGGALTAAVNQGGGPFRLGARRPHLNDNDGDGVPNGPFFRGMYDDVKIFNYIPEEYQSTDTTGTATDEPGSLPRQVQLRQNYPNPFNPSTTIQYVLPSAERVSLGVYDVLGRRVATLVDDERKHAGAHEVQFDASTLASGVYFYRLDTGDTRHVRKMLLIK